MEFVKLLNAGRFHSSIYHRLLDAIVSLVSDFFFTKLLLQVLDVLTIVHCRFTLRLILRYSWIYLLQSTSSTLMSGMLITLRVYMFFRLLLFGHLRFDSRYRFCVSYFTYISMEKFVKTLEASVSGAFYSFLTFSLFNRHDA